MPKLNTLSYIPWQSLFFIILCGLYFSSEVFAVEELDLLEEFGIEVFQTDPARQAELEAQKQKDAEAALPPYISPKTLAIDEALDAVNLETPTEPEWESIEHEISLTGIESQECCLRAIRSTRYEVEARCKAMGKHIWNIESMPVTASQNGEEAIKEHKSCKVYHNNITKEALAKAAAENPDEPPPRPDYYLCRARSSAKCFDSSGANAIFVTD